MTESNEIYDEVAYCYDGTLEGLLCAIFTAYEMHENPTDVICEDVLQPRLSQRVAAIDTNLEKALRVKNGLKRKAGWSSYNAVLKAACSSRPDAGTIAYRFVRYAMDEHKGKNRPYSNISHPAVSPLFALNRSISQECEHMRQFIRFEHLRGDNGDIWYAKCNPRDSVIPLVMNHFVERFSVQPFIIHDENHDIAGVFDGTAWYLVRTGKDEFELNLPDKSADEAVMQDAWRRFYRSVSIDARHNPELRQHFMPKRLWKNLTEMQEDLPGLKK